MIKVKQTLQKLSHKYLHKKNTQKSYSAKSKKKIPRIAKYPTSQVKDDQVKDHNNNLSINNFAVSLSLSQASFLFTFDIII